MEEARGETERLSYSIKRVSGTSLEKFIDRLKDAAVMDIHSKVLVEMQDFIKKAWTLVLRCAICHFFEREGSQNLRRVIFRINNAANTMDDFLTEVLPTKLKEIDGRILSRVTSNSADEKEIT